MKLMFISDIHGSIDALHIALNRFKIEQADKLVILGDILYHGPRNPLPNGYNPKEVAEVINQYKDVIIAVRGNCDSEVDQMVLEFPMRADYIQLSVDGQVFFLTHGHLYNNEPNPLCQKGTIFAQGHTHIPMIMDKNGVTHYNPGSITLPKMGHPPTYGIYDQGQLSIRTLNGEVYPV